MLIEYKSVLKLYLNYQIVIWRCSRLLAVSDYSLYKMKIKHRIFDKVNDFFIFLNFEEENKSYLI